MNKNLAFASLLLVKSTFAAATLQFSAGSDALSNISDTSSLVGIDGLAWGIVIDTAGDNFQSDFIGQIGLSMTDGASLGNGYLFYRGVNDPTKSTIFDSGVITTSFDLNYSSSSNGDAFGIIWFDGDFNADMAPGLNYGLITNADLGVDPAAPLVLPDVDGGGTTNFAPNFAGEDPVRNTDMTLVPEPSTALLAFLGMAGLIRRRR